MRGCRSRAALLALVLGLPAWGMALPSAQSAPPAIVVQDDRGSVQSFAVAPQRVVSLLPSLTESVCALGACDRLVGTDRYSNSPSAVVALPKLGGIEDANLERIVALRPDVVLAAPSTRVVERLESLGLKVVLLESKTHADVRRTGRASPSRVSTRSPIARVSTARSPCGVAIIVPG